MCAKKYDFSGFLHKELGKFTWMNQDVISILQEKKYILSFFDSVEKLNHNIISKICIQNKLSPGLVNMS